MIIYRTAGAWGAGSGANLTPAQVDLNFYDLSARIADLENNPPQAVSIESIDVTGNLISFTMTNATTLGPFVLPTARFRWTGEWTAGTEYFENDIFTNGLSLYMVLVDHVADATFDPARFDSVGFVYLQMLAVPDAFIDIGFFYPGVPGYGIEDGEPMLAFRAVRDFWLPGGIVLTQAGFESGATHEIIFSIRKNGSEIGTWSSDTGFVFTADVQFVAGDVLSVVLTTPLQYDETARNFTITFVAVRGTFPV